MSLLPIHVRVDDKRVLEVLARVSLVGSQRRALFDAIGSTLVEGTRLRFIAGEAPDGTPWVPSQRATVQGGQTLRDTGRLMNSITHAVSDTTIEVGTNVEYAVPLHFGAHIRAAKDWLTVKGAYGWFKKKEVVLPPRPILGLSDSDARRVLSVIARFLDATP